MNTPGRARSMAALLPNATLVEVPVASGYVQHSAPGKCVATWHDFVQGLKRQPIPLPGAPHQ